MIGVGGLGFASYILSIFQEAGEAFGFKHEVSRQIVSNIFTESACKKDFAETVSEVATRGGATEKGLQTYKDKDLDGIIKEAFLKAYSFIR